MLLLSGNETVTISLEKLVLLVKEFGWAVVGGKRFFPLSIFSGIQMSPNLGTYR